jgi:glycine cleavage system H protein
MPDDLVFLMGQYEARIPRDRCFSANHLWLKPQDGVYRVGFTSYSVRLLRDVYFLDWTVVANTEVRDRQEIGEIESSKALSTLYAPAQGRIVEFNTHVLDDPSLINTDNYEAGWLFAFETTAALLAPTEYIRLLETSWEQTQRLLKGQLQ